jgi:hypothetical protein
MNRIANLSYLSLSAVIALMVGARSPSHPAETGGVAAPTALVDGIYWDLVEGSECSDTAVCVSSNNTAKCYQRANDIVVGTDIYQVISCYTHTGGNKGTVKSKKKKL